MSAYKFPSKFLTAEKLCIFIAFKLISEWIEY